MEALFSKILNMSLTASIIIALVLLVRLLLKNAPKIYSYVLWSVVLFRLLCPLSFSAGMSILGLTHLPVSTSPGISTVSYQPVQQVLRDTARVPETVPQPSEVKKEPEQVESKVSALEIASWIWLTGASGMVLYSIFQYFQLRRHLVGSVVYRGEVYLADDIESPFVMGVLRPRVYLPSGIPKEEQRFIIAHERHHIRRCDPLWKLLGYIALCLHWFNPLVWLAFVLAGKDMEMSCDEAVIRKLGEGIRADYSQALLRLATHKKVVAGMPLAFGEGDTKGRVLNMARWKKPKVWVRILCVAACLVILVVCALNPKREEKPLEELTRIGGPAGITAWDLYYEIPQGCTNEMQEKGEKNWKDTREGCVNVLTDGVNTIGGVMAFPMPEDFGVNSWEWLYALELPEWKDDTLGHFAEGTLGDKVIVEFFSDVPPGQEQTVRNVHTLYFWENWVYDLWFDELMVKPEVEAAILDSVRVGEDPAIPVVNMPYEIKEMPEGYSYEVESDGSVLFQKADSIVGGIIAYAIPDGVYDPNDTAFIWLEDVGIPDFEDKSLIYMGGISNFQGGWSAEFASDVPEGVEPTVNRRHNFNVVGDVVYDFWLDRTQLDENDDSAFQHAVHFTASPSESEEPETGRAARTNLTFIPEGLEEAVPATLYTDESYSLYIPDGDWQHVSGNLDGYPMEQWQSVVNEAVQLQVVDLGDMSLPQAQAWTKETLPDYGLIADNRGGLGGTDEKNNIADISFHPAAETMFAIIRKYPLEAAEGFGSRLYVIADTFAFTEAAPEESMTPEETAFAECFAVMDGLQDGSCLIQTVCKYQNTPEDNYIEDFYHSDELGMLKIIRTAGSEIRGELYANDRYFTGMGNSEVVWAELSDYESNGPWLGSFNFIRHYVTYIDTLTDGGMVSYMFRVDALYEDIEGATPYYFATFDFDADGNFLSVNLQINLFQDNAYTLTEYVVSQNAQEIAAEISREYQRAIG